MWLAFQCTEGDDGEKAAGVMPGMGAPWGRMLTSKGLNSLDFGDSMLFRWWRVPAHVGIIRRLHRLLVAELAPLLSGRRERHGECFSEKEAETGTQAG